MRRNWTDLQETNRVSNLLGIRSDSWRLGQGVLEPMRWFRREIINTPDNTVLVTILKVVLLILEATASCFIMQGISRQIRMKGEWSLV